jgi:hypothetical protein
VWSSDTLYALERSHLVQLGLWSGASLALGVVLLAILRMRRSHAPLLTHFAIQMALWGAAELLLTTLWWQHLAARDFAGASRLTTFLRLAAVAELACLALGATLAIAGWTITRRIGTIGAGTAVVVQSAALLALDVLLLTRVAG